jgi:hypothetical protein
MLSLLTSNRGGKAMLRTWISRIRGAVFGRRMEQEFASEMETHLALLENELVRRGMARDRARREARRQFGGVAQARELRNVLERASRTACLWRDGLWTLKRAVLNTDTILVLFRYSRRG